MIAGLIMTTLAFLWARCATADQPPADYLQLPLVVAGILAAGIAIWRCCTPHEGKTYLDALSGPARRRALLLLATVHALAVLAISALLLVRLGGSGLPGDLGGTFVLWLLTAPWGSWSAWYLVQRANDGQPLPVRWEAAVLTTQGGVVALLGSWALYWGADLILEWDSLRLFLAVTGAVAFLAAPIIASLPPIRRLAVSVLVVVHFAAIVTVVIGAPPGPYIFQEAQHWIFRPYLDFMYLNNAYRFYSPEPSPASQLWFRVEYSRPIGNTGKKEVVSHWIRLPDMDEEGNHHYLSIVQYTRRLALTENVARSELQIALPDVKGNVQPFIKRRLEHLPVPESERLLGRGKPKEPEIPLHPVVINYQKPTPAGRELLRSYARHVLGLPVPKEYAGFTAESVKIYRVWHLTCTARELNLGLEPHDWTYYVPYYQGKFDSQGHLLDPDDAFLYWALPIIRDNPYDPAEVRCYLFRHSGDLDRFRSPKW
jgi:hypothetical protein